MLRKYLQTVIARYWFIKGFVCHSLHRRSTSATSVEAVVNRIRRIFVYVKWRIPTETLPKTRFGWTKHREKCVFRITEVRVPTAST